MAPYAEIRSFDQWNLLLNMKKVFRFELFKPNVFDTYQTKETLTTISVFHADVFFDCYGITAKI